MALYSRYKFLPYLNSPDWILLQMSCIIPQMGELPSIYPDREPEREDIPHPEALIYVVEDVEAIRLLHVTCVRSLGYKNIKAFSNGAEALDGVGAAMQTGQPIPDVIVSDYRMPGMNGIQLADILGQFSQEWRPTFVFVTGNLDRSTISALEARAFGCLNKPVALRDLCEMVMGAVKHHFGVKSSKDGPETES